MIHEEHAPTPQLDTLSVPKLALTEITVKEVKGNEWVARFPEYILRDRQHILTHPGRVHKRIFVGPSAIGKSVVSAQWGGANERSFRFQQLLPHGKDGKRKDYLSLHVSLSQGIGEAAHEAGLSKSEAAKYEKFRVLGTQRMIEAVEAFDQAFTDHPDYHAEISIDTVGITKSDLGTSLVQRFADDPTVRFFGIIPWEVIEQKGLALREGVAESADDPRRVFEALKVDPGATLEGHTDEFVESHGTREAWRRHWTDIFAQMQGMEGFEAYSVDDLQTFLDTPQVRYRMYEHWLPGRMAELGVDSTDPAKFEIVQNPYIGDGLHIHFGRMYGKETRAPGKKRRHFPMHLLDPKTRTSDISAAIILDAIGQRPPAL